MFVRALTVMLLSGMLFTAATAAAQTGSMPAGATTSTAPAMDPDKIKAALKSVDLTRAQKRQILPMVQSYKSQTANADSQTKSAAQKTLLKGIYGVMTPAQQSQFKASLIQSM